MLNKKDTTDYVNTLTTVGVICGIYWGIKKNFGIGKTALCAIALGIAANYLGNTYHNFKKEKNEE